MKRKVKGPSKTLRKYFSSPRIVKKDLPLVETQAVTNRRSGSSTFTKKNGHTKSSYLSRSNQVDRPQIRVPKRRVKYIKNPLKKELVNKSKTKHSEEGEVNEGLYESYLKKVYHYLNDSPPLAPKSDLKNKFCPDLGIKFDRTKPLLVLDMDETLLHSDFVTGRNGYDVSIVNDSGRRYYVNILLRPHLSTFLDEVSKLFNLALFTASEEYYASEIIEHFDPEDRYFCCKLFRQHCIQNEDEAYVKDLRIFRNFNLKDVLIVDNSPNCFLNQLGNGIPIVDYTGDSTDTELLSLLDYLRAVWSSKNMAVTNRKYFKLADISKKAGWQDALSLFMATKKDEK